MLAAIEHRFNHILHRTIGLIQENAKHSANPSEVWSRSAVFGHKDLTVAFLEVHMAQKLFAGIAQLSDEANRQVVRMLARLYACTVLDKASGYLMESYLSLEQLKLLRAEIVALCAELGESAVRIVDAIEVPDQLLGSVLGRHDGQVYKHLTDAIEAAPGVYEKPAWVPRYLELRNARPVS